MLILHPYKKPFPYNQKKKTIPMLPTLSYLSPTKNIDLSSGLVEIKKNISTMSHWKKFPLVSILYIYRILCKQWDLNPHSFTLLFPKNSLSTNFNMLT